MAVLLHLDEDVAARLAQRDESCGRQFFGEVAEAADAVAALRERRVELQQRALEQAKLRRDLAIAQHLQGAAQQRHDLLDRRLRRSRPRRAAPAAIVAPSADQVFVGDELVAVALHHLAGERAAADHENLLVVLFQFLDQRDEIAVAADDHVGVDVRVRERHLQRIERQVDVGAVLVAAGRQVALHQLGGVLRQRAAVVPGARPVAVGSLGDDIAALLQRFEDDADVELGIESVLDTDLDVVEIDEDGNLEACFWHVQIDELIPAAACQQPSCGPDTAARPAGGAGAIYQLYVGLFVMERFDRIEARVPDGGIEAENDTNRHRDAESKHDRRGGHDGRPTGEDPDQLRKSDAKQNSGDAAGQRNDRRLDQELPDAVTLPRADGAADADLARPLQPAGQHDVHDPDAADQQRDRRDRHHHHLEDALRAALLGQQFRRRHDGEVPRTAVRDVEDPADHRGGTRDVGALVHLQVDTVDLVLLRALAVLEAEDRRVER